MARTVPRETAICGGTVVSATGSGRADVLVADGRVSTIGVDVDVRGMEVIDARGCFVLPGGIDAHTHLDFAPGSYRTADDFTSGTEAAVLGGTTCVIDFVLPRASESLTDAIAARMDEVGRATLVADVGLHLILNRDLNEPAAAELRKVMNLGICDFKLYLAHRGEVMIDDAVAYRLLSAIAEVEGLALVHAENGGVIHARREMACAAGDSRPLGHAHSRPSVTETEAVRRTMMMAELTGVSVYLVHISAAESLVAVLEARARGVDVTVETCPQYLVLDKSVLCGSDACQYIFAPPPRSAADRDALWRAVAAGQVNTVASDHSPYLRHEKEVGHLDFRTVPNGIPGVQERLSLLYQYGVRGGHIGLDQLVQVFSTGPARIFGMPRKGTIAVGLDADLVVFDPTAETTLGVATSGSRCDFNAYEGTVVSGAVDTVLVRGHLAVQHGRRTENAGFGKFIRRIRSGGQA